MRRILLVTLAGLGLTASAQAIAGNAIYDCQLAALPNESGRATCAPPVENPNIQPALAAPGNGPVTRGIRDALSQMQTQMQPWPGAITVGMGPGPQMSVRVGEQVPTLIEVDTNTQGLVTRCSVVKGSGSERADATACDFVKTQWPRLKLQLSPRQ